jgi:hypothetical protein
MTPPNTTQDGTYIQCNKSSIKKNPTAQPEIEIGTSRLQDNDITTGLYRE